MTTYYNIKAFTDLAGFSRQRLYQLWHKGDGPQRVVQVLGFQRVVLIPTQAADEWLIKHGFPKAQKEENNHVQY